MCTVRVEQCKLGAWEGGGGGGGEVGHSRIKRMEVHIGNFRKATGTILFCGHGLHFVFNTTVKVPMK